jgi:UDP-2,3-diacylglucosamine pyrophosphatase LpxH
MTPSTATGDYRRAVFVSDVHLGAKHCHAAELADFLDTLRCGKLYLVGDTVDLW